RDLRGHERDPAARDRPLDPRADRARARPGVAAVGRNPDEPVRLTRIYTRGGDAGETSLGDGSRVPKTDPRVEAVGQVDELNSLVGWALAAEGAPELLRRIQNELFDVGADLATPQGNGRSRLRVTPALVEALE